MVDLSAIRFLDRFAYRNPKSAKKSEGTTVKNIFKRKAYTPLLAKSIAVNSKV